MKILIFNTKHIVIAALIALMTGPAIAAVPHSFANGDTIRSSEMNANFTALDGRITTLEALEARINALETHAASTANPHSVTKADVGLTDVENIKVNFTATTTPGVGNDVNDGYFVGSVWIDTATKQAYVLVDATADAAVWKVIANTTYEIGDTGPAGGIVFYLTEGGLHGLEVAPADQGAVEWGCYGTLLTGAVGTAIGTGAQNTADILAGCTDGTSEAATLADAFSLNGYADWFLPSKDELNQLYLMKDVVGGFFASDFYWSSSQSSSNFATVQLFIDGNQFHSDKVNAYRVRAVRAF